MLGCNSYRIMKMVRLKLKVTLMALRNTIPNHQRIRSESPKFGNQDRMGVLIIFIVMVLLYGQYWALG